jgi:hypothetical protein
MAYSLLSQSGQRSGRAYGVKSYVADTPEDLKDISTNIPMGCSAYVISTKERYMLNSNGEWKLMGSSGGSGGGEGGSDDDEYGSIPFDEIDSYFSD